MAIAVPDIEAIDRLKKNREREREPFRESEREGEEFDLGERQARRAIWTASSLSPAYKEREARVPLWHRWASVVSKRKKAWKRGCKIPILAS